MAARALTTPEGGILGTANAEYVTVLAAGMLAAGFRQGKYVYTYSYLP